MENPATSGPPTSTDPPLNAVPDDGVDTGTTSRIAMRVYCWVFSCVFMAVPLYVLRAGFVGPTADKIVSGCIDALTWLMVLYVGKSAVDRNADVFKNFFRKGQ